MKPSARIPLWLIAINWLITVIAGSISFPLIVMGGIRGGNSTEDLLAFMFMAAIISAILSIPALVILLITTHLLNKKGLSWGNHWRIQNLVHLLAAILTFGVIALASGFEFMDDGFALEVIPATYTTIGLITANITYWICKRHQRVLGA